MPDSKRKLLIVDDDVLIRTSLSLIFMGHGYKVRSAEDGTSALADMRVEAPDVVLSDLYMPGMSGFELLSVIRLQFPEIPVIAMSSAFSGGEIPTGVAADGFYEKATNIVSLLKLVGSANITFRDNKKEPRPASYEPRLGFTALG